MSQQKFREDVLFAFAVESERTRSTLDRYLSAYPEFAEDLIDLANEIRLVEATARNTAEVVEDEQRESAWTSFKAAGAVQPSPFIHLKGRPFVEFCISLQLPRSVVAALRDRLVDPGTIPVRLIAAMAAFVGSTSDAIMQYFALPPTTAASLDFKSDQKPSDGERVTFQQLIQNTELTDSQQAAITEYLRDVESH